MSVEEEPMNGKGSLYDSAKSMTRNPLGIIALFIVLVYAVASIVISQGNPDFYQHPFHPAVIFLATFPLVVLGVFTYLVACHHRKLYGPQDYKDQAYFFYGLRVPAALRRKSTCAATSDTTDHPLPPESVRTIEARYQELVRNGFTLLHQCEVLQPRTSPRSGRYQVRVWIESIEKARPLSDIDSVTYHIWSDFRDPVLSTSDVQSDFDLWLNIYGEFPVLAVVKLRSGQQFEIQRYIDLPGRPPD